MRLAPYLMGAKCILPGVTTRTKGKEYFGHFIYCFIPIVLLSSQALSKVLPGVTTRTKGKACFGQ